MTTVTIGKGKNPITEMNQVTGDLRHVNKTCLNAKHLPCQFGHFFSGNHSKQQFSRASVLYFLFPDKGWGGGTESMFVWSLKVILFWGGVLFK